MTSRHVIYPALMIALLVAVIFVDSIYVAILTGVAGVAVLIHNNRYQRDLDRRAQRIMDAVAAESMGELPDRFVIYLRPFELDRRARKNRLSIVEILFGGFGFLAADRQWSAGMNSEVKLEKEIAQGLECPLLVIGDPRVESGGQGAAAIRLDANWQDRVERLIDAADAVIFVPGQSVGAQYELSLLEASPERMEKTVFLIPNARRNEDHASLRDDAFNVIQELGVQRGFPRWHRLPRDGAVLRFVYRTVRMIGAHEHDDLLMSFNVLAMCQEITGRAGLANLNRPAALPEFFLDSGFDTRSRDEAILFQRRYPADWDIKKDVITRDRLSEQYVDHLSMVFTHDLQIHAADLVSRQTLTESGGTSTFEQSSAALKGPLEVAAGLSMIVPMSKPTVSMEIDDGDGRFALTGFGATCVQLVPVWIRLRDETRENPVAFDVSGS